MIPTCLHSDDDWPVKLDYYLSQVVERCTTTAHFEGLLAPMFHSHVHVDSSLWSHVGSRIAQGGIRLSQRSVYCHQPHCRGKGQGEWKAFCPRASMLSSSSTSECNRPPPRISYNALVAPSNARDRKAAANRGNFRRASLRIILPFLAHRSGRSARIVTNHGYHVRLATWDTVGGWLFAE